MSTLTTNFSIIKPGVNDPTDQDLWGGYLNSDLDTIDSVLKGWIYTSVSSAYPVVTADCKKFFAADATGGAFSITLVDPTTVPAGWSISVKKIDASANAVTLIGTVDGATNLILDTQYDSVQLVSTGTAYFTLSRTTSNKTGMIESFGGSSANIPANTLLCDGAAVSRTTYARLFAKVGTLWGSGNGTTTFNVPLLNNGYFLRGYSIDSTVDPDGPRAVGTFQDDALKNHDHTLASSNTGGSAGALIGKWSGYAGQLATYASLNGSGSPYTSGTSDAAAETRPVNKAVCFVINT